MAWRRRQRSRLHARLFRLLSTETLDQGTGVEMDIREALYTTRAMRRVKPDPVPEEIQLRILDAAILLFKNDETLEVFDVPEDQGWRMACCVPMGYPLGKWGTAARLPAHEVSHRNT